MKAARATRAVPGAGYLDVPQYRSQRSLRARAALAALDAVRPADLSDGFGQRAQVQMPLQQLAKHVPTIGLDQVLDLAVGHRQHLAADQPLLERGVLRVRHLEENFFLRRRAVVSWGSHGTSALPGFSLFTTQK